MSAMTPISADDPRMVAWKAFQASEDYVNTKKWALKEEYVDGSLWAAFLAGYGAARREGRGEGV